jgi:beta-glucosidase/6-phospho-beta-glucosidase/beta-galactosidase
LTEQPLFKSFFVGGFECSTHRTKAGRRLDLIAATAHNTYAAADYLRLQSQGIRTVRSGIRWHLIEKSPGHYDFSSALQMIRHARETNTQIIWDLCHYGWPDYLDVLKPEFVQSFARMSRAFAELLANETNGVQFISPINEISFLAWASGEVGYFYPYTERRGFELKTQLVRAAIESIEAVWSVLPETRILHSDPVINIVADPYRPHERADAEGHRLAQYQAWDMLAGHMWPQLGGAEKYLDIIGVNYYPHNQWIHNTPAFNPSLALARTHKLYRPFKDILLEIQERYRRPLFIAETGAENETRVPWLAYIADEVAAARNAGAHIEGICLYPIINHPGWDDDRHCHNGLWDYANEEGEREIYGPLADELHRQQQRFSPKKFAAAGAA